MQLDGGQGRPFDGAAESFDGVGGGRDGQESPGSDRQGGLHHGADGVHILAGGHPALGVLVGLATELRTGEFADAVDGIAHHPGQSHRQGAVADADRVESGGRAQVALGGPGQLHQEVPTPAGHIVRAHRVGHFGRQQQVLHEVVAALFGALGTGHSLAIGTIESHLVLRRFVGQNVLLAGLGSAVGRRLGSIGLGDFHALIYSPTGSRFPRCTQRLTFTKDIYPGFLPGGPWARIEAAAYE